MLALFEDYQEKQMQERRFLAGIHGINLDKEMKKQQKKEKADSSFMFGDPKDYKKMSKSERDKKTKEMIGKHRNWAGNIMRNV